MQPLLGASIQCLSPWPSHLLGLTFHASEQERPDVKAARDEWFDAQNDLDPERLIFIDESGLSTNMARLRGWARNGERCRAAIPHDHWKTITFVGGLTLAGFVAPMLLDGPMNGECFLAWVEQMLVPTLRPGHIEARGAKLLYLLPYSPDFNPIENAFAKAQGLRAKRRSNNLRCPRNPPPPTHCSNSNPTNA
jgi:hypothetical protein